MLIKLIVLYVTVFEETESSHSSTMGELKFGEGFQ